MLTKRDLQAIQTLLQDEGKVIRSELTSEMDKGFGEVDKQFGEIDKRFGEVDKQFTVIKKDIRRVRKDVSVLIDYTDRHDLNLQKRVKRIENVLDLPTI